MMIRLYRVGNFFFKRNVPFIPKLMEIIIFFLFNSRIPSSIKIGKGSSFSYQGLSTLLVQDTEIGEDCVIGMRVTTGRNFPYKNVPKIGNKVWIGTNSVIIGPVDIGDNVVIAPNSFVNKSIPEYAVVGGNPAKIIGDSRNLGYNIFDNPKYQEGYAPIMQKDLNEK